jgi:hypothetical protein
MRAEKSPAVLTKLILALDTGELKQTVTSILL